MCPEKKVYGSYGKGTKEPNLTAHHIDFKLTADNRKTRGPDTITNMLGGVDLKNLNEEQLVYGILGFFAFCLTGLPGLVFSGLPNASLLTNVVFALLVAAAAFGWIQLVLSARFLHKADKAHVLMVGLLCKLIALFH